MQVGTGDLVAAVERLAQDFAAFVYKCGIGCEVLEMFGDRVDDVAGAPDAAAHHDGGAWEDLVRGLCEGGFAARFARGEDISDIRVLTRALEPHVQDSDAWLAAARTDEVKNKLRSMTETAASIGIFGAPGFRVGDEIFRGDDRLDDAVA